MAIAGQDEGRPRKVARLVLAVLFLAAGVLHLAIPEPFIGIVPDWVPVPRLTVLATGLCEIAGAAGLMLPPLRRAAGIGLALYAVCVWPANVHHMVMDLSSGTGLSAWYHIPRQFAQPLIIWWALWASGAIDWPVRLIRWRGRRNSPTRSSSRGA
ncbi:DoxX family protein [Stakelama pacifica]|uniref:Putative membrane protein n=1 Tax=Stakelama pacifica TaxID=517720 RepID=A0A4R6FX22_9SPHN|nr:DoxX family protein [Stakelama pacifica]TDN86516.1 putative membrane protein [Stakelama pacifica]